MVSIKLVCNYDAKWVGAMCPPYRAPQKRPVFHNECTLTVYIIRHCTATAAHVMKSLAIIGHSLDANRQSNRPFL